MYLLYKAYLLLILKIEICILNLFYLFRYHLSSSFNKTSGIGLNWHNQFNFRIKVNDIITSTPDKRGY